jgi:D-sedoheptulose 7-phosphate isomerase
MADDAVGHADVSTVASAKAGLVVRALTDAAAAHERMAANVESAVAAATAITTALKNGGSVLVFGNGGSAADAQHFAAELIGRFERERRAWPAIALSTDTSALTAIGNDYGFDRVFARQLEALGKPGDVAIGITTSGNSPNVLRALELANDRGLITVALTGRGGEAGRLARVHVRVDEERTARVQEVHITLLHAICELVEKDLNG